MSSFTRGPLKIVSHPQGDCYWIMPATGRIASATATVWAKGHGLETAQANAFLYAHAWWLPDFANRVLAARTEKDLAALQREAETILAVITPREVIG